MSTLNLVGHFDGGCRNSGSLAAGAAVIYDDVGNELGTRSQLLRGVTTPVAEYTGLHLVLQLATEYAGLWIAQTHLVVLGDSELVIRQVNKHYRSTKPHLTAMRDMTWLLMRPFASCRIREFPKAGPKKKRRFGNVRADELCNICMDAAAVIT